MVTLPQSRPLSRVPRAHLEANYPAVLGFPNGQRIGANLQVISVTGGLLWLSQPLVQGSRVALTFPTGTGAVLGGAEMLPPVTKALQPFRFISLAADDHRRLGALIWERSGQNKSEQVWIDKLRAALSQHSGPRRWWFKLAEAVGLFMIGPATAAYLLRFGVLK